MTSLLAPALRMIVALGVVLALMYVAARLLRRTHGGSPVRTTGGSRSGGLRAVRGSLAARRAVGSGGRRPARRRHRLEVLARQPLGKSASVAVVRVGGRTLLVGVTESSVQLLGDVDATAFEDDDVAVEPAFAAIDAPDALTIPDADTELARPTAGMRSTISVMDVLRERTVRRA